MKKFQHSPTKPQEADEDLENVDSGVPQKSVERVIADDDEFSISSKGLSAKQKAAQQERSTLAAHETRAIFCLRLVVLLSLMIVGVSFALALFKYTNVIQEQEFEDQFGFYRDQVFEKFNRQLERTLNAMDTLSSEITSHAESSGSEFPFVTVPNFEVHSANARISGDAVAIFYMPYITEDLKVPWETYATANRAFIKIALDSEEARKVAQDQLFGLKPPQIDGLAGEYLELLESLNGTSLVDTSKIWTLAMDGKHVSCLSVRLGFAPTHA